MADDVSLRDYVDARLQEFEKRLNERFDAQEKATRLAVAQSHWMLATAISIVSLMIALTALLWKH